MTFNRTSLFAGIPTSRPAFVFIVVALLLVFNPEILFAVQGGKKGTITKVSSHWPSGTAGYRFARVEVSSTDGKAFATEQRYQVVVVVRSYRMNGLLSTTVVPLTVEQGNKSGTAEICFPNINDQQFGSNAQLHVERVGGNLRYDPNDLHSNQLPSSSNVGFEQLQLLFVASDLAAEASTSTINRKGDITWTAEKSDVDRKTFPNLAVLDMIYPEDESQQGMRGMMFAQGTAPAIDTTNQNQRLLSALGSTRVHAVTPDSLPGNWLGLTGIEVIFIPANDLKKLHDDDSLKVDLLKRWVSAGGFLVVYDSDSTSNGDGTTAPDTDRCFEQVAQIRTRFSSTNATEARPWFTAGTRVKENGNVIVDRTNDDWYGNQAATSGDWSFADQGPSLHSTDWPVVDMESEESRNDAAAQFILYDHLAGTVCFVPDNMTGWNLNRWAPLLNTARQRKRTISENIGTNTTRGEPVADFSIPGVGRPPVRMFQFLICLFLFAIGPLCFTVLKKRNRMQLLFFIVPATSAAACAGLLLYASLADGFQLRGRSRSLTMIDHRTNEAVTWCQQSYYSGIQPGRYSYRPDELAIMTKAQGSRRALYARDNESLLVSGGDARARMPHQITSVRTFNTEGRLVISGNAISGDNEAPQITNRFETTLLAAWVRTDQGLFFVGKTEPGESTTADADSIVRARNVANDRIVEISPRVDDEFYSIEDYRGNYNYYGNYYADNDSSRGLCELRYQQLIQNRLSELIENPNTYLAIFEQLPDETVPRENIDFRDRIHIVNGQW